MKIVSIKSGLPYDLYCGRANKSYGLKQSKWANPYTVEEWGRDKACEMFETYVRNGPLWNDLEELDGLTLACWCGENQRCHVKILINLLNEKKLCSIFGS